MVCNSSVVQVHSRHRSNTCCEAKWVKFYQNISHANSLIGVTFRIVSKVCYAGAIHSQKKQYYYSYISSYLKAVIAIAKIWNSILCFTAVLRSQLQPARQNYIQSLFITVQTALNFAAGSFCCKIILIWLGSSLSVHSHFVVESWLIPG